MYLQASTRTSQFPCWSSMFILHHACASHGVLPLASLVSASLISGWKPHVRKSAA